MILGALTELGLDIQWLAGQLQSIPLDGLSLKPVRVTRGALSGTRMEISVLDSEINPAVDDTPASDTKPASDNTPAPNTNNTPASDVTPAPDSAHRPAHRPHRTLQDFVDLLQRSPLPPDIRSQAIRIFTSIARAEARVHGKSIEQIHFHELGYLDSVIDIVGALLGIKALGIEKIYSSPLHLGTGFINTAHGTIPVPAPATLELLTGIPVYSTGIPHELVTPTGAAIISTLASGFGPMPSLSVQKTGYGAGTRELKQIPNLLRVIMGTAQPDWRMEQITTLEADIDDMNPEYYDYLMARLFSAGALDVSLIPVVMKKNRPATRLNVLAPASPSLIDELCSIIIRETTTLGIRIEDGWRKTVYREIITVFSSFGPVRVKVGKLDKKVVTASPEYEDCRRIALETQRPLKEIYQEAIKSIPPEI